MPSPNGFYRAALGCGLAPLAIGTAMFLFWLALPWEGLGIGVWTSVALMIASVVCLLLYAVTARRREPGTQIFGRLVIGLIALLGSLLGATVIEIAFVLVFISYSSILIYNDGPEFDRLVVRGACREIDFGPVARGERDARWMRIEREGPIEFCASRGGKETSGVLVKRLMLAGQACPRLTFHADGTWSVEDRIDKD